MEKDKALVGLEGQGKQRGKGCTVLALAVVLKGKYNLFLRFMKVSQTTEYFLPNI